MFGLSSTTLFTARWYFELSTVDVVQHELEVRAPVPVHAERVGILSPPSTPATLGVPPGVVGDDDAVVQVDRVVAQAELPHAACRVRSGSGVVGAPSL